MDVTEVTLATAAKIRGKIEPAGKIVVVDQTVYRHLKESGAIGATTPQSVAEVVLEDRAMLEQTIAEQDSVIGVLTDELKAMEARAVEAEAQRDLLQGRVLELQAQTAPGAKNTPASQAAEATNSTPPKKAHGGGQKG